MVNKTVYYYLILLSNLLFSIGISLLAYFIYVSEITNNISFYALILFIFSYIIIMFIAMKRKYVTHFIIYLIGFVSTLYILYLKNKYDNESKT